MFKDEEIFHVIKKDKDKTQKAVEFISGKDDNQELKLSFFDRDGNPSEEKNSYAKIEAYYVEGEKKKEKYFIPFNMNVMCHPLKEIKRKSSAYKEVRQEVFLHYMNFLINKKERCYDLAQKKQREQKTM